MEPTKQQLRNRLDKLKLRLEEEDNLSMDVKFDILDEILDVERKLGLRKVNREDSDFECFGCGS